MKQFTGCQSQWVSSVTPLHSPHCNPLQSSHSDGGLDFEDQGSPEMRETSRKTRSMLSHSVYKRLWEIDSQRGCRRRIVPSKGDKYWCWNPSFPVKDPREALQPWPPPNNTSLRVVISLRRVTVGVTFTVEIKQCEVSSSHWRAASATEDNYI